MCRVAMRILIAGMLVLHAASGADARQRIRGDLFRLKDPKPGVDASQRELTVVGRQDTPGEGQAQIEGDPTVAGATLQVVVNGGVLASQSETYPMPASGWRRLPGKPTSVILGYAYDDPSPGAFGPIRSAIVKAKGGRFLFKARILGTSGPGPQPHIGIVPPDPGTEGGVAFTIGDGDTYCVTFGGEAGGQVANSTKSFQIADNRKLPTVAQPCLLPATSVPTTTTTTPSSVPSTTPSSVPPSTSTTVGVPTTTSTSVTTTTIPATCADAGIVLPNVLPDVKNCTAAAMPPSGCNGWQTVGREYTGDPELQSVSDGTAQLYKFESGTTLCLYLYRTDPSTGDTLNGVHCYNTTNCDVCAFDYVGKNPTWPKLDPVSDPSVKDNCSKCHAAGPITPKKAFKDGVAPTTEDLNTLCAERGGPRWINAPATYVQQDPTRNVPAPAPCDGCHTGGFVKGAVDFCNTVRAAFGPNGAMAGNPFTDGAVCRAFAAAMGCDPVKDLQCP